MENELTLKDYLNISHSLGIDLYKAVMSDKKKDKQFPKEFYRNYYNTSSDTPEINKLVDLGLMKEGNKDYYHVTEEGIDKLKSFFEYNVAYIPNDLQIPPDMIIMLHKANIMGKIDFYCEFYNIDFGLDNPAVYIVREYTTSLDGFPVGESVANIIKKFKKELKKYF